LLTLGGVRDRGGEREQKIPPEEEFRSLVPLPQPLEAHQGIDFPCKGLGNQDVEKLQRPLDGRLNLKMIQGELFFIATIFHKCLLCAKQLATFLIHIISFTIRNNQLELEFQQMMKHLFIYLFIYWYWGLNSEPHTC
jgi:hypothetical protein